MDPRSPILPIGLDRRPEALPEPIPADPAVHWRSKQRKKTRQDAALKTPGRAHARQTAHQQSQVETRHVDQQSLAHVGVAPHEDPTQPSRGELMRERSLHPPWPTPWACCHPPWARPATRSPATPAPETQAQPRPRPLASVARVLPPGACPRRPPSAASGHSLIWVVSGIAKYWPYSTGCYSGKCGSSRDSRDGAWRAEPCCLTMFPAVTTKSTVVP